MVHLSIYLSTHHAWLFGVCKWIFHTISQLFEAYKLVGSIMFQWFLLNYSPSFPV